MPGARHPLLALRTMRSSKRDMRKVHIYLQIEHMPEQTDTHTYIHNKYRLTS